MGDIDFEIKFVCKKCKTKDMLLKECINIVNIFNDLPHDDKEDYEYGEDLKNRIIEAIK